MAVILVTGASSGIGRALATELANQGHELLLAGRNLAALQELAASFRTPVVCQKVDLERPSQVSKLAKVAMQLGVSQLYLNAGLSQRSLARDTSFEVDQKLMQINYFANVQLTKEMLPHLRARGARIVVVSSLVGLHGSPFRSGYSASKHALHGFYSSLAAEEFDAGLRVTVACPGFIKTNLSLNAVTGDGSPLGTMDDAQANGMDPGVCAKKIIAGANKSLPLLIVAGKERIGYQIQKRSPKLFQTLIRRAEVR